MKDKYDEKAEHLVNNWMGQEGPTITIAKALRGAAADALEMAKLESNCRREHGGTWEHFEQWLEKKVADLWASS